MSRPLHASPIRVGSPVARRQRRLGQGLLGTAAAALLAVVLALVCSSTGQGMRPRVNVLEATNLSLSPGVPSGQPNIAVTSDGTVHAIWEEGTNIVHRYRPADSDEWSPPAFVFRQGHDPALAANGRTVVAVFVRGKRDATEDTEVLYKVWDGARRAWPLLPEQVQPGTENIAAGGQQPAAVLSADGAVLWLVWIDTSWGDQRPYYARIRLADHHVESAEIDAQSFRAQGPAMASGPDGRIHVAWSEQSELKKTAYVAHFSRDETTGWEPDAANPYFLEARQARSPDIAVSAHSVCLTWHENMTRLVGGTPEPNNEIVLHCNDREWNISNSPTHSLVARLALDDLYGPMTIWRENGDPREIVFRQGHPPPANDDASVGAGQVEAPAIAFAGGQVYAAWVAGSGDEAEVFTAHWPVAIPTATPVASATPTRTPWRRVYCPLGFK